MPNESASAPQPVVKEELIHFLAHMGHDLRAPMTNVLALTEALIDGVYGGMPSVQSETLKHIRDNGHRMISMVTDLVDLARFETGEQRLEPAVCEIMDPCRNGVDVARDIAKSKKITLSSEFVPPSATAMADARRLRQMVAGLTIAAAVSAPADGQVAIRVEAEPSAGRLRLEIRTAKRNDQINLGDKTAQEPAAAAASLQKLRKMSSVAVTTMEKLVHLHQGTLEVRDCGVGSVGIVIELPLAFQAVPQTAASAATPAVGAAPAAATNESGTFILLADDEEIIRTITKDYLESTGYRVACVTNGREALDLLQKESPDLVIMDMQMPVLDGMEALVQLRRSPDPRIAKTPVISLSGLATPGHRERCLAAGANECLAKPFGIKDLERVIQDTLSKAR